MGTTGSAILINGLFAPQTGHLDALYPESVQPEELLNGIDVMWFYFASVLISVCLHLLLVLNTRFSHSSRLF
jgi:hypothetical protein